MGAVPREVVHDLISSGVADKGSNRFSQKLPLGWKQKLSLSDQQWIGRTVW